MFNRIPSALSSPCPSCRNVLQVDPGQVLIKCQQCQTEHSVQITGNVATLTPRDKYVIPPRVDRDWLME